MSEYIINLADINGTNKAQLRPRIKGWLDNTDYFSYWSMQDDRSGIVARNIALLASKIGEICGRCNTVHAGIASLHKIEHCNDAIKFNGFTAHQTNPKRVVCCICHKEISEEGTDVHMMSHTFFQKFLAGCASQYYPELENSR